MAPENTNSLRKVNELKYDDHRPSSLCATLLLSKLLVITAGSFYKAYTLIKHMCFKSLAIILHGRRK